MLFKKTKEGKSANTCMTKLVLLVQDRDIEVQFTPQNKKSREISP